MPVVHAEPTLEGAALAFLSDPPRFGSLATTNPDGSPLQAIVWYEVRDGEIVLNSAVGRRWPTNLLREPRCSLMVLDTQDGYLYVAVRGTVRVVDDPEQAQADIAGLARRYHGGEPAKAEAAIRGFRAQRRISFMLVPERVAVHL